MEVDPEVPSVPEDARDEAGAAPDSSDEGSTARPTADSAADPAADRGETGAGGGLSRRDIIRRAGIGSGVALAAGVLSSATALGQTPTVPDPSRSGRTPDALSSDTTLATKQYVDARVLRSGDTMTGDLLFSSSGPASSARLTGTSSAHHFDLVSAGTRRLRLSSDGALEATVSSASFLVGGQERLALDADGGTRLSGGASAATSLQIGPDGSAAIRATTFSVSPESGPAWLTFDPLGSANFSVPVDVPAVDEDSPDSRATTKKYVNDLLTESLLVPAAQGGRRPDGVAEEVFFENDTRVTVSHTIGVRYDRNGNLLPAFDGNRQMNAMTAGPITVAEDAVITVPQGGVWTVV